MSEEATTTTTTTATTDVAATSAEPSDAMEEAVAALESPEPVADSAKASSASEKAAEKTAEKKEDASSKEVIRAEAAALKARLRAERELRMAKQRAASVAQPVQQPQQTQQQTQQPQKTTPEEDALVDVVKKAIGLQTGEKPDPHAVEEAVAKMVQQQLAAHAEEQRRQAAKLAVVSHLESARDKLPLLSAFADDRIDDVYEVLIDEYVSEYRANGRKLTVAEAADRVERKLSDAIARLAGLTAQKKQQEPTAVSNKAKKRHAAAEDDDPEAAVRDAIAALTSKEPRT
jgi:hypothetical protein